MDSILKVIYSRTYPDAKNKTQYYLNGVHPKAIDYIDKRYDTTKDINDIIQQLREKNSNSNWDAFFRHSNFLSYYKRHHGTGNIVGINDIKDDGHVYIWPIEVGTYWGDFTNKSTLQLDDEYLEYSFIDTIEPTLLAHIRAGRVKIVINIIHDPLIHAEQIYMVEKYFESNGIDPTNITVIGGNDFKEYYKEIPTGKLKITHGYIMVQQAGDRLLHFPYVSSLGYVSDMVRDTDLDINTIRPNRFLSWNRTMRQHRVLLAYLALKYDLLQNNYFSFLNPPGGGENNIKHTIRSYSNNIDAEIYGPKVHALFPYDLDTHHLNDVEKRGFPSNNNKKEFYLNSYVHITTESAFYENISCPFFSEKTFHPMVNLQPFVYIGCVGALKRLKEWGIQTFHPFIDESYDDEVNPNKRLRMIEEEIKKLNNMPIQELHNWYYSITDILLQNQQVLKNFNPTNPFEHALKEIETFYGNK